MLTDNPSVSAAATAPGRYIIPGLVAVCALLLAFSALPAFAGGSDNGAARTFGAYQLDLDSGPVSVKIQGHSATQVVTIRQEQIPAGVRVQYTETGGILHVKVVTTKPAAAADGSSSAPSSQKSTAKSATAKQAAPVIVATMPRYEFVHIKTSSGSVSIDNLSTDHLTIQTGTGGIHVTNTNAALKAESTAGDQSYEQIYGAIEATSTTGDVSVANTWGTMKLKSDSGSFVGNKVALAGNSTFRTSSGSIKINLVYGLGRYSFDLKSSSGKLRLGQISRTGAIRWGSGNISVTSITKSGAQDFQ